MILTCTNQGCYSSDHHKLDEQLQKVICNKCSNPITVSPYALKSLKALGQIIKKPKADFEATCSQCGVLDAPVIKNFGKTHSKVICKHCGAVNEHLTKHFTQALKGKIGIEIVEASPEEMSAWGFTEKPVLKKARVETVRDSTQNEGFNSGVPEKVEYYPYKGNVKPKVESGGIVTLQPGVNETEKVEKAIPALKTRQPANVVQNRPKARPPNEDLARKRAEVLLTAEPNLSFQPPPPQGVTAEDIFNTGLSDYASEGDSD